jgi:hypothetical protein
LIHLPALLFKWQLARLPSSMNLACGSTLRPKLRRLKIEQGTVVGHGFLLPLQRALDPLGLGEDPGSSLADPIQVDASHLIWVDSIFKKASFGERVGLTGV